MPFLVADPQPDTEVDHYIIELDSVIIPHDPETSPGFVRLHYDVSGVTDGLHTVRVKSGNMWGESAFTDPFDFTKALPPVPTGIGLEI